MLIKIRNHKISVTNIDHIRESMDDLYIWYRFREDPIVVPDADLTLFDKAYKEATKQNESDFLASLLGVKSGGRSGEPVN